MNQVLAVSSAARTMVQAYTVSDLWSHGISIVWLAKCAETANATTHGAVVEEEAVGVPLVEALMVGAEVTVEDDTGDTGLAVAWES